MTVGGLIRQHRSLLAVGAAITLGFLLLYAALGAGLATTPARPFAYGDILFELDTPRVIAGMTSLSADHYRTKVHPLYALLVNPLGSTLANTEVLGAGPTRYAVALNALFAALSVLLAFLLFWQMSRRLPGSLALSLVFAFSMSHLLLSLVPDTSSLATLSLLVTHNLFWRSLYRRQVPLALWVIAGVFSLGVTTTNLAQTAICYAVSRLASAKASRRIPNLAGQLAAFGLPVLAVTSLLALIQKAIYPSSWLFFLPSAYAEDLRYASLLVLRQPLLVVEQLVKHFFAVNVVGAVPQVIDLGIGVPALTFSQSWRFAPPGILALLLWGGLASLGWRLNRAGERRWFYLGLALCLLFNLLLHAFYGVGEKGKIELFLYTGNFTFLVLTLLLSGYLYAPNRLARLGLALLLLLLAANNLSVVRTIARTYDLPPPAQAGDPRWADLQATLAGYRHDLAALRREYGPTRSLPPVAFFLFGLGDRQKYVYQQGVLSEASTGRVVRRWEVAEECIVPPAYTVALRTTDGREVYISEDSSAVWLEDGGPPEALSQAPVSLPAFAGHRHAAVLKVLHHELLVNVVNGRPLPNLFVYDRPWYRDAAMMGMAFQETGNLHLLREWILGLREPYDRNNGEPEADNLGQALYLISLVSARSHPLVPQLLAELERLETGGHIAGRTDFAPHPVYQTKWARFGLQSLGFDGRYRVPQVADSYAALFWWGYQEQDLPAQAIESSLDYPYLTWAAAHYVGCKLGPVGDRDYPLTWEANASQADYEGMRRIAPAYVEESLCTPHTWHAAEAFLRLLAEPFATPSPG